MPRRSSLVTGIDALRRLLILELLISFKSGNTGKLEVGPGGGIGMGITGGFPALPSLSEGGPDLGPGGGGFGLVGCCS